MITLFSILANGGFTGFPIPRAETTHIGQKLWWAFYAGVLVGGFIGAAIVSLLWWPLWTMAVFGCGVVGATAVRFGRMAE